MAEPHTTDLTQARSAILYREKLYPSVGVWFFVLFVAGATLLALLPINLPVAIAGCIAVTAAVTIAFIAASPVIMVTRDAFTAGKARIEHQYLGDIEAYDGDAATAERGTRLHGLAYLCIRGWVSPVVKVFVVDDADTTPYWLVSTRHPLDVVKALQEAREAL